MQSLLEGIRTILGNPDFYLETGQVDYGAVYEYVICGVVLCVVVASVFKFLLNLVK